MPYVAALPAVALIAGAAAGLVLPSFPSIPPFAVLLCSAVLSMWAWHRGHAGLLASCVAVGFCTGGALLSADAWQRAWRPPLRIAFEEIAREQRARAIAEGRRMPEDDQAFVGIVGALRADAAQTESGVSLSVAVEGIERQEEQAGKDAGRA